MTPEQVQATGELAEALEPSALALAHGLHEGISEEQYHRRVPGLASKHTLDSFAHSPATYYWSVTAPEEPGGEEPTAFLIGKAVHCAALEPARFATAYACAPKFADGRSAEGNAQRAAFATAHPGAIVLTERQWADVTGMAASVRRQPRIATLLAAPGTRTEVTARWAEATATQANPDLPAVECKARADIWCPAWATLVDLKTTQDASAEAFSRDVEKYGYHDQDGMYRRGWRACGEQVDAFAFAVVEKAAPYLCAVYTLEDADVVEGDHNTVARLRRFARCLALGEWPGFPEEIQTIARPAWARKRR